MASASANPDTRAPAVLGLIGHTKLIEVSRFDTGPCPLFLSHLPVLEDGRLVGLLDESDILIRIAEDDGRFADRCARR